MKRWKTMIGSSEILIIAVVVLVLFGAAAIPRFAPLTGQGEKGVPEGSEGRRNLGGAFGRP